MSALIIAGLSLFLVGMLGTQFKMAPRDYLEIVNDDCINRKCDYLEFIEHGSFNF